MNKKIIIGITLIIIIGVAIGGYFLLNNEKSTKQIENTPTNPQIENDSKEEDNNKENDETKTSSNGKILVVYYSASGSTKNVANQIANNLNADLFEIVPKDIYTSEDLNYGNPNSRVSKEHDDESLRNIELKTTTIDNWDEYDTIIIGYPIWWGIAAWPVNTFVKSNNFDGKTVIPFCTSASSGLGESDKLLENTANGGNWLEGKRFSSRPSDSDILDFTNNIKL